MNKIIYFGIIYWNVFLFKVHNCVQQQYSGLLDDLLNADLEYLNISFECNTDLNELKNGLENKEIWAIKMLDASGHIGSGFVWGNNYWLGSKHACTRIQTPTSLSLSNQYAKNHMINLTDFTAPMPIEYRVVYIKHNSKWQLDISTFEKAIIHLGLCVPKSCSDDDIVTVSTNMVIGEKFEGSEFLNQKSHYVISTKTLDVRQGFFQEPVVVAFLCIFAINFFLTIFGNFYEALQKKMFQQNQKKLNNNNNNNNNVNIGAAGELRIKIKRQNRSFVHRLFSCFSISKNIGIITSKSVGQDSIEVIHGMRAIGIIWIISGHIFFYGPGAIDNLQMVFTYAEIWYYQPMFSVAMVVDSYFVISGLVLAYLFFQSEKKEKQDTPAAKFYKSVINRYLRLTPTYVVILLLTGFVSTYLRDASPFWMIEPNDINCSKYWWRNLLYINNLFPMADMCMSWSWFLAADFQCFVLSTLLLIITIKCPKIGLSLFGVIFLGSSVLSGYFGYILSYSLSLDVQYKTVDYLYSPTTTRIGCYFVGIFAGWFLSHSNRQWKIRKTLLILFWIICPMLNLTMIFGSTNKEISQIAAMFYTGLGKVAWSIGIAWIIIACATGHGGIVTKILNSSYLLPFSRMSYMAYLLNPLIIITITMSAEAAIHLDFVSLFLDSMGLIFIVFWAAFIFMIFFENPFIRFTKLLQGK